MRTLLLVAATLIASPLCAQSPSAASKTLDPPNPRPTVRAGRATGALRIDGRLAERDWARAIPVSDFRTVSPAIDEPSAYRTEVRVLFTDQAIIIGALLHDTLGRAAIRMQDLRRDFDRGENDWFQIVLDPLHDTRSAISFQVTPYGSLRDLQAFDGGDQINDDWDGVWRARTAISDSGWTAEIELPWASLRYVRDGQPWGINFARLARRTIETSGLVPWPRQFSPYRMTFAADLVGLEPPAPRANIRLRPFALGDASQSTTTTSLGRPFGRVGGEVMWSPSANSLLELTANTDFAQADVDRQVVNLRRFSVFFPERRQFFLENTDVLRPTGVDAEYVVQPFFSRQIGLAADGTLLPITGGGRVSWRSSRASAGALAIRQGAGGAQPGATFAVARGSRFFTGATRLGAFAAVREDDATDGRTGSRNIVTAIDGLTRLGETVQFNAMLSTSTVGDTTGIAATYFVGRDTPGLYTGLLGAWVTDDYAPRTGFVSRPNVFLTSPAIVGTVQPAWRPKSVVWFKPALVSYIYQTPDSFTLQEGYVQGYVDALFTNGALVYPYVERHFQRPTRPFELINGVTIDAGTQDYWRYGWYVASDRSAPVSLLADASTGTFFDGTLDRLQGTVRVAPSPRLALSAGYEVNRLRSVGTRDTSVTTHLFTPEVRLFATPRLQLSAFYQYNTEVERGTLNARMSWEFSPLSFFYLVYNDRRAIGAGTQPTTAQLVAKLVWLKQL